LKKKGRPKKKTSWNTRKRNGGGVTDCWRRNRGKGVTSHSQVGRKMGGQKVHNLVTVGDAKQPDGGDSSNPGGTRGPGNWRSTTLLGAPEKKKKESRKGEAGRERCPSRGGDVLLEKMTASMGLGTGRKQNRARVGPGGQKEGGGRTGTSNQTLGT